MVGDVGGAITGFFGLIKKVIITFVKIPIIIWCKYVPWYLKLIILGGIFAISLYFLIWAWRNRSAYLKVYNY